MKTEMRRSLANQSFEEKIRKIGELIRLAKAAKKRDTIPERLDIAAAQLDAGQDVPIEKVRENVSRWAKSPRTSLSRRSLTKEDSSGRSSNEG
jgi:hypothetical protein